MYPVSMVHFCVVVGCTNKTKKRDEKRLFYLPAVITHLGEIDCKESKEVTRCMAGENTQTRSLRLPSKAAMSLWVTVGCIFFLSLSCEESLTTTTSTVALILSHILTLAHLSSLSLIIALYPSKFSNSAHPVLMCSRVQLGWSPCDEVIRAQGNGRVTPQL